MERIVIAGAGMAGLRAAESLREAGFEGAITLVGEEEHPPYSRPPLSKEALTDHGPPRGLELREGSELAGLELDLRLGRRASRLVPQRRAVELSDGSELLCDGVIVTTGVAARRPSTPVTGVHVLRTLDDAVRIRQAFQDAGHVAVVGAGFIGAEVAASARARGLEVTMIETAATPFVRAVDPRVGGVLTELHRDHGVDLRLGVSVTAYEGEAGLERLRLSDGTTVETTVAVVGTGVRPNTDWLADSGVELADDVGGVRCDATCATTVPNVYAAGDVASWPHPRYGGRLRLEHWTNAGEQAGVAARNLLAGPTARQEYTPVPYFWSDQYGMKIQLLGRATPADTVEIVHGSAEERKFVAFFGRGGRLVGVLGLRSTPKVMRYRRLLERDTPWEEALAATG